MGDFELRRAEPGQEFGYTTTERINLDEGEDPPEGTTLGVDTDTDADGNPVTKRFSIREGVQRTIKADDQGVVTPRSDEDVRILDTFDLPVARKAIAERQADKAEPPKTAKE